MHFVDRLADSFAKPKICNETTIQRVTKQIQKTRVRMPAHRSKYNATLNASTETDFESEWTIYLFMIHSFCTVFMWRWLLFYLANAEHRVQVFTIFTIHFYASIFVHFLWSDASISAAVVSVLRQPYIVFLLN